MVDYSFIVEALKKDSQIQHILEMAEICETAVFSVGHLERPSVLFQMGLITQEDYQQFHSRGAVGDCCSHILDKDGNIFDKGIDERVVGAPLDTIKKIPNKLLIASGKEKVDIISAALKGGLADSLYIDEGTAEEVILANP